MNKLVSIVIPVYKTEKHLENSVSSALSQTYLNTEIILVDDGSPDNCPKLCDKIASENKNVSVIHKKNGGLSSARNSGIEKASGEFIVFLDSDDTLSSDAVADMVKIAEDENADAVIPYSYYKVYENNEKKVLSYHFTQEMFSDDSKEFALNVLIGKGRARRSTAVLYNLNVIKKNCVSYPVGKISEDFFFNLDFFSAAHKISLYDKPSLNNLKRNGSISSSYYEDFFNTVLEMDIVVEKFINSLDINKYKIAGKRETLFFRNLLIFAVNVMGDKKSSYSERCKKCRAMFLNDRFQKALHDSASIPFFEGKFQKLYMSVSLKLLKYKMYSLTCFFALIAAKINTV